MVMRWLIRPHSVPSLSIWAVAVMGIGLGIMIGVVIPKFGIPLTADVGWAVMMTGVIASAVSERYARIEAARQK